MAWPGNLAWNVFPGSFMANFVPHASPEAHPRALLFPCTERTNSMTSSFASTYLNPNPAVLHRYAHPSRHVSSPGSYAPAESEPSRPPSHGGISASERSTQQVASGPQVQQRQPPASVEVDKAPEDETEVLQSYGAQWVAQYSYQMKMERKRDGYSGNGDGGTEHTWAASEGEDSRYSHSRADFDGGSTPEEKEAAWISWLDSRSQAGRQGGKARQQIAKHRRGPGMQQRGSSIPGDGISVGGDTGKKVLPKSSTPAERNGDRMRKHIEMDGSRDGVVGMGHKISDATGVEGNMDNELHLSDGETGKVGAVTHGENMGVNGVVVEQQGEVHGREGEGSDEDAKLTGIPDEDKEENDMDVEQGDGEKSESSSKMNIRHLAGSPDLKELNEQSDLQDDIYSSPSLVNMMLSSNSPTSSYRGRKRNYPPPVPINITEKDYSSWGRAAGSLLDQILESDLESESDAESLAESFTSTGSVVIKSDKSDYSADYFEDYNEPCGPDLGMDIFEQDADLMLTELHALQKARAPSVAIRQPDTAHGIKVLVKIDLKEVIAPILDSVDRNALFSAKRICKMGVLYGSRDPSQNTITVTSYKEYNHPVAKATMRQIPLEDIYQRQMEQVEGLLKHIWRQNNMASVRRDAPIPVGWVRTNPGYGSILSEDVISASLSFQRARSKKEKAATVKFGSEMPLCWNLFMSVDLVKSSHKEPSLEMYDMGHNFEALDFVLL